MSDRTGRTLDWVPEAPFDGRCTAGYPGLYELNAPHISDCGAVPSINNGSFVLEMDSTYMSIATVECDADFAPSGDCSIMCQPDGNWSVSTAECVPESMY